MKMKTLLMGSQLKDPNQISDSNNLHSSKENWYPVYNQNTASPNYSSGQLKLKSDFKADEEWLKAAGVGATAGNTKFEGDESMMNKACLEKILCCLGITACVAGTTAGAAGAVYGCCVYVEPCPCVHNHPLIYDIIPGLPNKY